LDFLKDKIHRAQGRIQDLEMERNDTRVRVARLESHKDETDERMRTLTGLVYEVSRVELGKFDPPLWHAPYGHNV